MRFESRRWPLWVALAWMCAACSAGPGEPRVGSYRAVLELPGGEAPLGLEVAKEQGQYVLYLANGDERTRIDNVQFADGELHAVFPGYENSLRARVHREGLKGSVTLIKAGGKQQVIPLRATHGATYRFHEDAGADNAEVAGRWATALTDDDGKSSKAVMVLEQQDDRVTGTVMTPTGDHRFLEGQVRGGELQLSTFAGGLPYLYKLQLDASGNLAGDYWQGLAEHQRVSAHRDDAASLEDAQLHTTLKDDSKRFDFTFPDPDGNSLALSEERFRDKVVLITLGGSWCPNCHDEAMFLVPFYREYRDKGFEILALMFERHGEFEKAARAVRGYRADLGIEYPTLIAGLSETDEAAKALPTLSGIYGYPTTILIDKKGRVRDIHTGFLGPATGRHYEEFVAEFRARVNALLAET